MDRINEIDDSIDLDAFEQIPGEAKFYRTSTEAYDDFVPPRFDDADQLNQNRNDQNNDEPIAVDDARPKTDFVQLPAEQPIEEMPAAAVEPVPVIDGYQFLELLKIFEGIGKQFALETIGMDRTRDAASIDVDVETKTESNIAGDDTTINETYDDTTTEHYSTPRTLKRPVVSQTAIDVMQAFKALRHWQFTNTN